MSNELFNFNPLDRSILNRKDIELFLLIPDYNEVPVLTANSVDPGQTPRSASDLGLNSLPMSLVWDKNGLNAKSHKSASIVFIKRFISSLI